MKKNRKAAPDAVVESRPEVINFVCRYDLKFNHARVHDDRKKKMKSGYQKHKNRKTLCDTKKVRGVFSCLPEHAGINVSV